ncbi:hypothetical protein [Dendronalium sp. ChiSLP03b]|nr:hypothetical protein [Dendronalium sp. ChiSLP03b]
MTKRLDRIKAIVSELKEIRDLRTETQRIVEHLFGRQENGK